MGDPTLTLLTISRDATPTQAFLRTAQYCTDHRWVHAPDAGYLERVLPEIVSAITTTHVLRLDDDEWTPEPVRRWLLSGRWHAAPAWKFPRAHRWGRGESLIVNPPLWPDWQTRLTPTEFAARDVIHAGSAAPDVRECPFPIVHDKFLKPYAERAAIAATYDQVMPGAGTGAFAPFNLPEDVWAPGERLIIPCPWESPNEN